MLCASFSLPPLPFAGGIDSGKSTLVKQFRIHFGDGYPEATRHAFINDALENLSDGIHLVLDHMQQWGIWFFDPYVEVSFLLISQGRGTFDGERESPHDTPRLPSHGQLYSVTRCDTICAVSLFMRTSQPESKWAEIGGFVLKLGLTRLWFGRRNVAPSKIGQVYVLSLFSVLPRVR